MKRTTLCYIEDKGKWLMLYRNRKPEDPNEGKWLGIGGKIEPGETPDECNVREVYEETGLRLRSARFCGVIHFRADMYEDEDMYLYYSDDFAREDGKQALPECDEGELRWIEGSKLLDLPMWEGDRVFLKRLLAGEREISMTLSYTGEKCTVIEE